MIFLFLRIGNQPGLAKYAGPSFRFPVCKTNPTLEELIKKGKFANWEKPDYCPCCGAVYWWHGFRERWCVHLRVFVRRVICSFCHKTKTLLPEGFLKRFQASSHDMLKACLQRIQDKLWYNGFSRQRIRWWVRVAEKMIRCFGDLNTAVIKCPKQYDSPVVLSRFWLTHSRVS